MALKATYCIAFHNEAKAQVNFKGSALLKKFLGELNYLFQEVVFPFSFLYFFDLFLASCVVAVYDDVDYVQYLIRLLNTVHQHQKDCQLL